jgi:hypothetical protein
MLRIGATMLRIGAGAKTRVFPPTRLSFTRVVIQLSGKLIMNHKNQDQRFAFSILNEKKTSYNDEIRFVFIPYSYIWFNFK